MTMSSVNSFSIHVSNSFPSQIFSDTKQVPCKICLRYLFSRFPARVMNMLEGLNWVATNWLLMIHFSIVFKQLFSHELNQEQGYILTWVISSSQLETVITTIIQYTNAFWRRCLFWGPVMDEEDTIYKLWARMILCTTFIAYNLRWRYTLIFFLTDSSSPFLF